MSGFLPCLLLTVIIRGSLDAACLIAPGSFSKASAFLYKYSRVLLGMHSSAIGTTGTTVAKGTVTGGASAGGTMSADTLAAGTLVGGTEAKCMVAGRKESTGAAFELGMGFF